MIQELAVVKLTKSILGKVGEKVTAKKKKWAEEAALSVEENKRREAEFKEDFSKVKEKLNPDAVKEEIQKGIEVTTKKVEELKPKGLSSDDVSKKAEEAYKKVVNHSEEKVSKREEIQTVESKKVEEKVTPKKVVKSTPKSKEKTVAKKSETKTESVK